MKRRYFDLMSSEYYILAQDFICDEVADADGNNFFADSLRQNSYIDKLKGLGTTHVFI